MTRRRDPLTERYKRELREMDDDPDAWWEGPSKQQRRVRWLRFSIWWMVVFALVWPAVVLALAWLSWECTR